VSRAEMPLLFFALICVLQSAAMPANVGAQRATPIGIAARVPELRLAAAQARPIDVLQADTVERRRLRALPFVLGGAAIGAFIGGVLAASYNPCGDDPQPGFYCTSTDMVTGAMIGMGVGAVAGAVLWALVRYYKPTPDGTTG
jgi:hypothetical protein